MQDAVSQLLSSPEVAATLRLLLVGLVALWVAAAWWTYQDMQRRSDSELAALGAVGWILVSTPLLLGLALPIYLLARPQLTVAQAHSSNLALALETQLLDGAECPGCGSICDDEWRRCPTCTAWLAVECAACGRWSSTRLEICPWCALERPALGPLGVLIGEPDAVAAVAGPAPVARPTSSLGGQRGAARRQMPARLG